jgi:polyvinyl alcohol dehydrogenase (cytochrome)
VLSLLVACLGLAVQAVLSVGASAAVPAWTTYRHDAARSGIDPDSTSPVTPSQAWQTPALHGLDGEIYAQPLVYGSYVYVATENDWVYKLNAATGAVVWPQHLGTPEPSSSAPCGDIDPSIGITSTPVIDPATNRIYLVAAVSEPDGVHHELFALNLDSGQIAAGFPIMVDPPFPAGAGGSTVNQLQRPGLALDGGRILIGYGGNDGDCSTYWGWLVSAPESGAGGLTSFQVDPGFHDGAIWGGGNAPAIDAAGNVFVATGNGAGDSSSDPEYGDSVVKLNASASVLDWWAPSNWQMLDSSDLDLGSSMPTLLPGGNVFQSGKDGNGYLLNGAHLGNVGSPLAEAAGFCSGVSDGGSVYDPANATIYAACAGGLKALTLGSGSPPSLTSKAGFSAPSGATGPPMIAGGLVWATNSGGTLYGLDPTTGATRSQFSIPEQTEPSGSDVNHFASPSAGGGRLFVASGDQVTAYTIAQPSPPTPTSTSLASSADPAVPGATVTLTAAVAPLPDAGTVTFTDGGAPISGCSGIAVSTATAGRAVCPTAFASTGSHHLVASYSGDAFYAASTSPTLVESITKSPAHGPVITHASISPRRFTARHGATLRVTLSEAATLTVAVTQLRHGHVIRHRCSTRARRGRPCRVQVTLLRLRFHAHEGRNAYKLSLRRLAAGGYTAVILATDAAGRRSRTVRITFTIVRARRKR